MDACELLADAFGRIEERVHGVLEGRSADDLAWRPDPDANSIAWLVWHLTRVEDDHVAGVAGQPQAWIDGGWAERFALPLDRHDTGWSHTSEQVGSVRADAEQLAGYFDAVHAATMRFVGSLDPGDLDRVVDERWDPPVTLGVRLISVLDDELEHVGQAAYLCGLLERR
jgi:hypothetical protein